MEEENAFLNALSCISLMEVIAVYLGIISHHLLGIQLHHHTLISGLLDLFSPRPFSSQ